MLTIREVIKTLYNALLQRLKKHRGNWDQNDPSADDYIKNRPFYTDDSQRTIVVSNQQITFSNYQAMLTLSEFIEFVVGQTYKVKWDDKTYSCVAFDMDGIGVIGNQGAFGDGTNTGEPFIMMISKAQGMGLVAAATPEAIGTHTVEVSCIKVVKLDKKYLPDLGLAPVATSGSYYDLEDTPAVYSDVVRYGTSQSLTDAQKTQARTNIGAASSADINDVVRYTTVQSLTSTQKTQARTNIGAIAVNDLATVATSGDYGDLSGTPEITQADFAVNDDSQPSFVCNRPCYDGKQTRKLNVEFHLALNNALKQDRDNGAYYNCESRTATNPNVLYTFVIDKLSYEGGYIIVSIRTGSNSIYNIMLYGNASLLTNYILSNCMGINVSILTDTQDTGENFAIGFVRESNLVFLISTEFGLEISNADIVQQFDKLKQLDEKYIPSTIQRTDDPVFLSDASGAKWRLTVGTDGTLSTEAVTE